MSEHQLIWAELQFVTQGMRDPSSFGGFGKLPNAEPLSMLHGISASSPMPGNNVGRSFGSPPRYGGPTTEGSTRLTTSQGGVGMQDMEGAEELRKELGAASDATLRLTNLMAQHDLSSWPARLASLEHAAVLQARGSETLTRYTAVTQPLHRRL